MPRRRNSISFRPNVESLEALQLLSVSAIAPHSAGSRHQLIGNVDATHADAFVTVRPLTSYTRGPVASSGGYRTLYDDRLRFLTGSLSKFSVGSANTTAYNAALQSTAAGTHKTGNYYVNLGKSKSYLIMWNNYSASRYDWIAVKYLGSNRFSALDRAGRSATLKDGQTFSRAFSSGGSSITLTFKNLKGSSIASNSIGYTLSIKSG
jgi:hypothetical protein